MTAKRVELKFIPGFNPSPDSTELDSIQVVDGNRVRFYNRRPQSVYGCESIDTGDGVVSGCSRFLINYRKDDNNIFSVIGSDTRLFALLGNVLTNITPLKTSGPTLANNPFAVTNADATVIVTHATHGFSNGDRVVFSGATDTGGILAANLNIQTTITYINANSYSFEAGAAATSTTSGGGASVVVKGQIDAGRCDASSGYGYGMGLYGVGRYGVAKTGYYPVLPRIWSGDFFGTYLILCPGTTGSSVGASIYQWAGATATAPTVVTNAPTDANYVFVDNNILVALCNNTVKWSDQGDQTEWTAAADNEAGSQELYGAGRLLSRAYVNGENLLFSSTNVYRMRYIGKPFIWEFEKLDVADGISGVHAAVAYDGAIYWQGRKDYYVYAGGAVRSLQQSSLREHAFQDMNPAQAVKSHCWMNVKYGECWWFYQSNNGTDVNKYVAYSIPEKCWVYGTWARTASERNYIMTFQRLVGEDNLIYEHEKGNSDNGAALNWFFETNYGILGEGDRNMRIQGFEHDGVQTGNVTLNVYTKLSAMSSVERTFGPYTLTDVVAAARAKTNFRAHGKMRKLKFSSSETESFFRLGKSFEYIKTGDGR